MTQRPNWFSRLDISYCEDYFNKVETFAHKAGKIDGFYERLEQLVAGDVSDDELTCWGRRCKIRVRLYVDFAPQSFEFVKEILYEDDTEWTFQFNGGIIFHGAHDGGGDGGAPTYSVNLSPQDGWSIHT